MAYPTREGQKIPDVTVHEMVDGKLTAVQTGELFAGKKVIAFSLPGAFTPTCSTAHVPRYNELFERFRGLGVDAIVVLSVNDAFVMDAWQQDQHAPNIRFLADGNGAFTDGMGLLVDKSQLGFGKRSWRYSMLVDDGTIVKQFNEPDKPGDPYEVSDADTMLNYLQPEAAAGPKDVLLFTKPGCGHCARAKKALTERGIAFDEVPATPGRLLAVSGKQTTPQVFIDGQHIGGADELVAWLAAN